MLIDWFTVGAQILNFLILVWLLKRFLYQPILKAIDAREQRIAGELADADAKKSEAGAERDEFSRKNADFDQQKAALLHEAKEAANAERQRLLDAARDEASLLSRKREETLQREAQSLHQEIRGRTCQQVFAIARKALVELAGATLEERMVEVFVARLQALSDDEKQALTRALQTGGHPLVVRTTVELPEAQQGGLEARIRELFGSEIPLQFETAADLVSGIELNADGQQVAWNIEAYLTELESSVSELLKAKEPQQLVPKEEAADEQ
jgi:F-type H+-transporting ATPase subunit b